MNRIAQYRDDTIVHRSYDAHGNFDSEVQLNMPRHFDPTVGQWMSEDPVGHAGDDENLRKYPGQ